MSNPTTQDVINILTSIDATLKSLLALSQARMAKAAPQAGVASDADLDSQYGDPEVRAKDPKDWTGEPMKGRKFSECPAEYLEMVADRLDYFASDNEAKGETTKARYNRLDASRARGWAARIRAGYKPPVPEASSFGEGFGDTSSF